ncbi:MAG: outer membrane protein assembly factor BamD [Rhodospirillaceae bacterium]
MLKLQRVIAASALMLVGVLLSACGDKELAYREQSVYEIYSQAVVHLENGRYEQAALFFDEVERQHPYSVWATKAKLMSAYSYYHDGKYDESVTRLDRFIQVHPGNRDIAYAYYLKSLNFYEQIADVRRDQEYTVKALDALQDVVTRFPATPYGRDARLKLDLTRDHLAGKEMMIGRFYENNRHYLAAINRFKNVVDTYSTTSHVPEALYRLTESFTALGLKEEAQKSAAVLGYNFPQDQWYRDAYALMGGNATVIVRDQPAPPPAQQ